MQKKPLIGLTLAVALITLVIMGCSSLTPAPEVKIISITKSAFVGGTDSISTTITFESKNKVDAIITTQQTTSVGPNNTASPVNSALLHYTFFVNAGTTAPMSITITGMNALRSTTGSPATMWIKFWGEDAYGYNKTFSDSVSVSF